MNANATTESPSESPSAHAPLGPAVEVSHESPTLEEATAAHARTLAIIEKYPEARRYLDMRREWSTQQIRIHDLQHRIDRARAKAEPMYQELTKLKAALPPEAYACLCQ